MGQKTNPTIFRLGINKTWKTEFFEKKSRELPLYIFKDLEIRNYIERILESNEMLLHDYKQHYNGQVLNLYISYFVTHKFLKKKKDISEKIILENSDGQRKSISNIRSSQLKSQLLTNNKQINHLSYDSLRFHKIKEYLNATSRKHLLTLQSNKQSVSLSEHLFYSQSGGVFDQIFKVLTLFMGSPVKINVKFCCLNKASHFLKHSRKEKTFLALSRFKNSPLFKEGIELMFDIVYNKSSANLLAKFIAYQLKTVKRQKFLLSFLKQSLTLLLESNFAKLKGIKIILKGRLNGVPRAKHKIILIGDVPVQTINARIDYAQTATHNSNGSYGIKVWLVEK